MRGDATRRYCDRCRLHVYDFSQLTTSEARALIVGAEGRLCGRLFIRSDGTLLTKDCPRGLARARRRVRALWSVATALVLAMVTTTVRAMIGAKQRPAPDDIANAQSTLAPPLHDASVIRAIGSGSGGTRKTMGMMVRVPAQKP